MGNVGPDLETLQKGSGTETGLGPTTVLMGVFPTRASSEQGWLT